MNLNIPNIIDVVTHVSKSKTSNKMVFGFTIFALDASTRSQVVKTTTETHEAPESYDELTAYLKAVLLALKRFKRLNKIVVRIHINEQLLDLINKATFYEADEYKCFHNTLAVKFFFYTLQNELGLFPDSIVNNAGYQNETLRVSFGNKKYLSNASKEQYEALKQACVKHLRQLNKQANKQDVQQDVNQEVA